jgi:hypothetical protein
MLCNHCEQYATTVIFFCCGCCCSTRTLINYSTILHQEINNLSIPLMILGPIHASYNDPSICTCTINKCINHAPNLYHQPVHQPCTKLYHHTSASTMHQNTTCHINLINQIRSIHQDQSQPYAQYHQDVHQPRLLTNINKMYHNQDVLLKVYPYIYAHHPSMCQLASASNNVPSMYQSCIIHRSSYDSSRCTNITITCANHAHQPYTIHHIP